MQEILELAWPPVEVSVCTEVEAAAEKVEVEAAAERTLTGGGGVWRWCRGV